MPVCIMDFEGTLTRTLLDNVIIKESCIVEFTYIVSKCFKPIPSCSCSWHIADLLKMSFLKCFVCHYRSSLF